MGVDGIDNTDKPKSGRSGVTREALMRERRMNRGRYIRIKGVRVWIPW